MLPCGGKALIGNRAQRAGNEASQPSAGDPGTGAPSVPGRPSRDHPRLPRPPWRTPRWATCRLPTEAGCCRPQTEERWLSTGTRLNRSALAAQDDGVPGNEVRKACTLRQQPSPRVAERAIVPENQPAMYFSICWMMNCCSEIISLTTSPIETIPSSSRSSLSTGR